MKMTITKKLEGLLDRVGSRVSSSFVSSTKKNLIPTIQKSKEEIKQTAVVLGGIVVGGYILYRCFSGQTNVPPTAINVVVNIENLYMGGKV